MGYIMGMEIPIGGIKGRLTRTLNKDTGNHRLSIPTGELMEDRQMQDTMKENAGSCCCGSADAEAANAVNAVNAEEPSCCGGRHKKRSAEEQKALLTRLRKVEGQIRGIEKMVENDMYCPDILMQVSAATSALNSFNKVLLACHIRGCVAEDIREGKDETIDELCGVLQKLMK